MQKNKCLKNLVNFYLHFFQYLIKTLVDRFPLLLIDFSIKYLTLAYMIQIVICDSLVVPDSFNK